MANVKGTYDCRGGEQRLRQRLRSVLERQFALYDFEPVETSVLNEQSLLSAKYTGGEAILREMYRLSDQRGRPLGLRYDLTVPFAKIVAAEPGLALPYKRYEIGKVFRDGPVKRGRQREFTQCDADVAGADGPEAEAELLQLARDVFRELGVDIAVRWNNRRFLGELLGAVGIAEPLRMPVMLTLDKLDKIGIAGVVEEVADGVVRVKDMRSGEQIVGTLDQAIYAVETGLVWARVIDECDRRARPPRKRKKPLPLAR